MAKKKKVAHYAKGGMVKDFNISESDWRRNKARELNAPVSGWSDKMLEGMSKNERTKYAKK